MTFWAGHIAYIAILAAFAVSVPAELWDPRAKDFIFLLGILALWRYSWWGVNLARYGLYIKRVFPKMRREVDEAGASAMPSHVYLLITSFRIHTETTRRVYDSVIREAMHFHTKHNVPVTIVVSIVEKGDEVLIKELFASYNPPEAIKVVSVRIDGTGKRDALAYGFRAIGKRVPPPDSVVAVVDGDSCLQAGVIEKCVPLFALQPKMAGLTTDEVCEVQGKPIFRHWYNMRFAQRHIYMSSVSLSRRVLTLTGRMSMFRASVVTDPDFVRLVEVDWLDHWRLGRFKFLTGDDKSTWYHLMSQGHEMLYVPDARIQTIENPPYPPFLISSAVLMRRWFGNMLRGSSRALPLGPKTMGWFAWWSLLDQRFSMWTALSGLVLAILATIKLTPLALFYYLLWMMVSRYLLTLSLLFARPNVSAVYPFLLYYNQIVGSFIKTYILFRLDRQKWTRQGTFLQRRHHFWQGMLIDFSSFYMHCLAFVVFIVALGTMSGMLTMPDTAFWYHIVIGK